MGISDCTIMLQINIKKEDTADNRVFAFKIIPVPLIKKNRVLCFLSNDMYFDRIHLWGANGYQWGYFGFKFNDYNIISISLHLLSVDLLYSFL